MNNKIKVLIGLLLIGAGVGLYWFLTRKRTEETAVDPQSWAVSDLIQGNQIMALANAVDNTVSDTSTKLEQVQAKVNQLTESQGLVVEHYRYALSFTNS